MKRFFLLITSVLISIQSFGQDITGQWNGILKVQDVQLRIVFHINKSGTGFTGTMDSPDQGAKGIPVTSVSFENNNLKITADALKMEYNGSLEATQKINGNFKQGAMSIPMNLSREEIAVEKPKRPQEPKPPFPYYTEDVLFKNTISKTTLAGTLSLPSKDGKFPAVILITGSGPQNRDEELMGHKPFLVIADYLTKNGFAVLRYDDRGIASSNGDFKSATSADFAIDAEAAVAYLKTRKEILPAKIGLIGHSEGGYIAPMIASKSKDVAFIVLLAGPGMPCSDLLVLQSALIAKSSGATTAQIEKGKKINKEVYDIVKNATNDDKLHSDLTDYLSKSHIDEDAAAEGIKKEDFITEQVNAMCSPWMQFFLKYKPAIALEKVHCPVLALNGERDLQVPPKENIEAIQKALTKAGNKKVTTKILPKLNHLFQECTTGSPDEYAKIEQTFSPIALNEILSWLKTQTK